MYSSVAPRVESPRVVAIAARIAAWHAEIIAHERRRGSRFGECSDECPHAQAPLLWAEAWNVLGEGAAAFDSLRRHAEPRWAGAPVRGHDSAEVFAGAGA